MDFNWYYNEKHLNVINETIDKCNDILGPIRSQMSKWDYIMLIYLIIGIVVTGGLGFIFAYFVHYSPAIIIGILYLVGILVILILSKKNAHEILLSSHIWMSFVTSYMNLKYSSEFITYSPAISKAKITNVSLDVPSEFDLDKSRFPLQNDSSAVKLRFSPGYLGKWLEIHNVVPNNSNNSYQRDIDQSYENRT